MVRLDGRVTIVVCINIDDCLVQVRSEMKFQFFAESSSFFDIRVFRLVDCVVSGVFTPSTALLSSVSYPRIYLRSYQQQNR